MASVDEFVVYDDVQFITRGWINRNNLLVNGEAKRFTISLHGASANKLINEIDIFDDFKIFKKTILYNYAKAPYLKEVLDIIDEICDFPDKNLARFIEHSFTCLSRYMGITTPRKFSSEIEKDSTLHAQDKIIDMAKRVEATTYINTIGGKELYDKEKFKEQNIELKFLQPKTIEYKQFNNPFVPNLSIIDTMMFNNVEVINKLLQQYDLV